MPEVEKLREAVLYALNSGCQVSPDALRALRELPEEKDPLEVMKEAVEKVKQDSRFLVEEEDIRSCLPSKPDAVVEDLGWGKASLKAPAREVEAEVEVLMDPTSEIGSEGSFEEFLDYFRSRFKKLSDLLRRRMDARGALRVSEALRVGSGAEVKIIGMVRERREGIGKLIVVLEDEEASATVVFTPKMSDEAYEKARRLMPDQVICVEAVKRGKDLFLAKELVGPDVPARREARRGVDGPLYAVLISDLHYGSKSFMEEELKRFLRWLNGDLGNSSLREVAGAVKYVVVAGDLVDGIGVYPGQEKELAITDIYRQYEGIASLLSELPDHLEVILIPGNHDACRRALPQPSIPKEYAEPLYEDPRTHLLGNPCLISLHGIRFLIYHGNSFDDLVSTVPGLSFDDPVGMMKLMLWARHLAPIYGMKTPLAPMPQDLLVIEEVPDVFHTGHVHITAQGSYRGILLINSGAWQTQTAYQMSRGIKPTPGRAVLLDLSSLRTAELDFTRPDPWA